VWVLACAGPVGTGAGVVGDGRGGLVVWLGWRSLEGGVR